MVVAYPAWVRPGMVGGAVSLGASFSASGPPLGFWGCLVGWFPAILAPGLPLGVGGCLVGIFPAVLLGSWSSAGGPALIPSGWCIIPGSGGCWAAVVSAACIWSISSVSHIRGAPGAKTRLGLGWFLRFEDGLL